MGLERHQHAKDTRAKHRSNGKKKTYFAMGCHFAIFSYRYVVL